MKKIIPSKATGRFFLILLAATLFTLSAAPVFSADKIVARLTDFSGTVLIKSRGAWAIELRKDIPLYSNDKVVTRIGNAVITFDDGAVMEIKNNSNLLIQEIEEKKGVVKVIKRKLRLLLGKLFFKTGKSNKKTILETATAVCGLRGTAGTLSIGADGQAFIQFTDGGESYAIGEFISGVAEDVPAEIADLNPAQRAAFVAAAAADQAEKAADAVDPNDPQTQAQAAYASAKAAEAAAQEAREAAEAMLNNPDPAVQAEAQRIIDIADEAIDKAIDAQQKAIDAGADPAAAPETYTVPESGDAGFDVDVEDVLAGPDIPPDLPDGNGDNGGGGDGGGGGSGGDNGGGGDGGGEAFESLFVNNAGSMDPIGNIYGTTVFTEGDSYDLVVDDGTYEYGQGYGGDGEAYIWNTEFEGSDGDDGWLKGFMGGIWDIKKFDDDYTIYGGAVAIHMPSDGYACIYYSDDEDGVSGNFGDGAWDVEGILVESEEWEDDPNSFPLDINQVTTGTGSLSVTSMNGNFGEGGGTITGSSNEHSLGTMFLEQDGTREGWGIYDLKLQGPFDDKPEGEVGWYAEIEGTGDFGPNTYNWEATIDNGTWSDLGEIIDGELDGFFGPPGDEERGIISGLFFGVNLIPDPATYGTWIGVSIGWWVDTDIFGEGEIFSLYKYNGESIIRVGDDPSTIGLVSMGDNRHYFLAMGDYILEGEYEGPYLQNTRISGDFTDGGSGGFDGYLGGSWNEGAIDDVVVTIHTDSDGNAGFLTGDVSGGYYSGMDKWKTKGTLLYVPMATGIDPDGDFTEKEISFTGAGGDIDVAVAEGYSASVGNQDWGVWRTMQAGTYDAAPSDDWALHLQSNVQDVNRWMEVAGSKWSAEEITAKTAGAWVNWNEATTGVMGGKLKGTFDPVDTTWQAVGMGNEMETEQFLNMIANGRISALEALNIPCIEVGRATLTGSSDLLNVHMNDVTFFAYSTGADPRIWATKDVGGSYSGIPNPGHTVNLIGGGLNANFAVNNWSNNRWGANVNGSGTLQRRDIGGTVNINFKGAAAGSYRNGSFNGTGAGTARR